MESVTITGNNLVITRNSVSAQSDQSASTGDQVFDLTDLRRGQQAQRKTVGGIGISKAIVKVRTPSMPAGMGDPGWLKTTEVEGSDRDLGMHIRFVAGNGAVLYQGDGSYISWNIDSSANIRVPPDDILTIETWHSAMPVLQGSDFIVDIKMPA